MMPKKVHVNYGRETGKKIKLFNAMMSYAINCNMGNQ